MNRFMNVSKKMIELLKTGNEHDNQVMLLQWFNAQYPTLREFLIAIPNGAILCDLTQQKRAARMSYLIAEGFKKGVSDLFLAVPTPKHYGLWLEMKAPGKTIRSLSEEQADYLLRFKRMGYQAKWAPGFDVAKQVIIDYLNERE